MTPRQHKEDIEKQISDWHIPLHSRKHWTFRSARKTMDSFKLSQSDIPLIIKLVENPKYDIGLFAGNVDLRSHDCIHVLLGRGLLVKDEAFVIGYTMGTTKKMPRWRRNLFMFISKYLYPEDYRFGEEERYVFNSAVMMGSKCPTDLSKVNFGDLEEHKVSETREKFGINKKDISRFYSLEQQFFKNSKESQRLFK